METAASDDRVGCASVTGAGHMVIGDDNAGFVGAIAPFLLGHGQAR